MEEFYAWLEMHNGTDNGTSVYYVYTIAAVYTTKYRRAAYCYQTIAKAYLSPPPNIRIPSTGSMEEQKRTSSADSSLPDLYLSGSTAIDSDTKCPFTNFLQPCPIHLHGDTFVPP